MDEIRVKGGTPLRGTVGVLGAKNAVLKEMAATLLAPGRYVLSNVPGTGICVPLLTTINDDANTTQTGIEIAFQYDLSSYEDVLGFASGFGVAGLGPTGSGPREY